MVLLRDFLYGLLHVHKASIGFRRERVRGAIRFSKRCTASHRILIFRRATCALFVAVDQHSQILLGNIVCVLKSSIECSDAHVRPRMAIVVLGYSELPATSLTRKGLIP